MNVGRDMGTDTGLWSRRWHRSKVLSSGSGQLLSVWLGGGTQAASCLDDNVRV